MKTTLLNWNSHSIKSWEIKSYSTRFAIKNSVHKLGVMYWSALLIHNLNKNQPTQPNHPSTNFFKSISLPKIKIMTWNFQDVILGVLGLTGHIPSLTWQLSIYSELPWGGVLCSGLVTTTLHFTKLHYTTLHYIILHFTTVHYTAL